MESLGYTVEIISIFVEVHCEIYKKEARSIRIGLLVVRILLLSALIWAGQVQ